ncbi:hypothetical protein [Pontimicrobium aquaticum]|uniref:dTDP-4-amino-4,6-dideoxygalactose transaminase n=1 Tax=Pontimicrobium aquaticum TaxID=2565367 RepID=A0A4U0EP76_9FLAO|nr:hypothetical protein [Pontimicrobium aquaticum]TJY33435.1 hypothetical protein E5167_13115 [Pontimicrobium aquaticum]
MSNKDIGSCFYELKPGDPEYKALTQNVVQLKHSFAFYYSGRNAFLAVFNDIESKTTINKIWLPSYYCDTVVNLINSNFKNVAYYNIDPFHFESDIDVTEFASKDDIVILNNFWGLSTFKDYSNIKEKPIIIEDHTHGWLSKQSLNSNADYCICSLRKTYPIPLGAITWMPNSNSKQTPYKDAKDTAIIKAYLSFNNSMKLKRAFIKKDKNTKDEYLDLLNNGESILCESNSYNKPNNELLDQINKYLAFNPNIVKANNFNQIIGSINKTHKFKILKREGFTPFGLLLLFKSEKLFISFKNWLISNNIYPAHLWPNTKTESEWKYLFNLHIDFRYNIEDISYLVEKINIWIKNNV